MQILEYKATRHIINKLLQTSTGMKEARITETISKAIQSSIWLASNNSYLHISLELYAVLNTRISNGYDADLEKKLVDSSDLVVLVILRLLCLGLAEEKQKRNNSRVLCPSEKKICKAQSNNCHFSTTDNLMHAMLLSLTQKKTYQDSSCGTIKCKWKEQN